MRTPSAVISAARNFEYSRCGSVGFDRGLSTEHDAVCRRPNPGRDRGVAIELPAESVGFHFGGVKGIFGRAVLSI